VILRLQFKNILNHTTMEVFSIIYSLSAASCSFYVTKGFHIFISSDFTSIFKIHVGLIQNNKTK